MFRVINCRKIAVMVRARRNMTPHSGPVVASKARKASDTRDLQQLITQHAKSPSAPNALHILEKAASTSFGGDKTALNSDLARVCKLTLDKNASSFGALYLARFMNH
jgi:hypothetical protein